MYAQVIEGGTTFEQRGEMDRIVAEIVAISTGTRKPNKVWRGTTSMTATRPA